MKKKMITLFAVTLLLTSTTFANGGPSLEIKKQFSQMFTKASEAKWEEVSNFYKVTFLEGGQYLTAFYNASGEFVSLSRNVTTAMLPLALQKDLQGKLQDAWVTDSFELYGKNGTEYYVTLENANEKTMYRSGSTNWSIYKRIQK